jgi:2-polyprenyl-6-hydroxyphenyl methylase/3-demethylubiquinone-9 3-methyltransferase
MAETAKQTSVDRDEIARFSAMADRWWDPDGDFAPLHRLNPARLGYIRARAERHFDLPAQSLSPLKGKTLLDAGCGGGLISEPMARLGARVTGLDAGERNIEVARLHAERSSLDIDYRCSTAEALAETQESFDIVLALEIIEHVADTSLFMNSLGRLLKPDGLLVLSTLNRTWKSYAFAIVGAEYVLRWLPRGTHDWRRFLRPSEVSRLGRSAGLATQDVTGLTYSPLDGSWRLGRDCDVNYMMTMIKA